MIASRGAHRSVSGASGGHLVSGFRCEYCRRNNGSSKIVPDRDAPDSAPGGDAVFRFECEGNRSVIFARRDRVGKLHLGAALARRGHPGGGG